eukprot:15048_1
MASTKLVTPSVQMELFLYVLFIGSIICTILSIMIFSSIISKYKICNTQFVKRRFVTQITLLLIILFLLSEISYTAQQTIRIKTYFDSIICENDPNYICITSTQSSIIDNLSSIQLILFHFGKSAVYILLTYRLYLLHNNQYSHSLFIFLIFLIFLNIIIYLILSLLHFKQLILFI